MGDSGVAQQRVLQAAKQSLDLKETAKKSRVLSGTLRNLSQNIVLLFDFVSRGELSAIHDLRDPRAGDSDYYAYFSEPQLSNFAKLLNVHSAVYFLGDAPGEEMLHQVSKVTHSSKAEVIPALDRRQQNTLGLATILIEDLMFPVWDALALQVQRKAEAPVTEEGEAAAVAMHSGEEEGSASVTMNTEGSEGASGDLSTVAEGDATAE